MKKTICLLFIMVCICLLTSCGFQKEDQKVIKAVEEVYMQQEVGQEREEDVGYRVAELIYSKMNYEVLETGNGFCKLRVSAPDMKKMFESYFSQYNSNKSFDPEMLESEADLLNETIEKDLIAGNYEKRTVDVTVPYTDGKIEETYELTDAFYGGLLTARDTWVQENINQGGKE